MSEPTMFLRHVWRDVNDGNGDRRVLTLQQWHRADEWDQPHVRQFGGYWQDVEISTYESSTCEQAGFTRHGYEGDPG